MPDPTSRVLVPAIAAALSNLQEAADILISINNMRNNPTAIQGLVLDGLIQIEHMRMLLCLEPPFLDELKGNGACQL